MLAEIEMAANAIIRTGGLVMMLSSMSP